MTFSLRRLSLTHLILVGMAAGILIGWLAPATAIQLKPLSAVFLRMIKSVVVPIIFGTLVIGIAGHGDDLKRLGRLFIKAMAYFWAMTAIALVVGLVAVHLTRPGVGVVLPPPDPHAVVAKAAPTTFGGFLEHLVPSSFFEAAVHNEVLQVAFWSTLFAIALSQVPGRPKEAMLGFCEGLTQTMFRFVAIVMKFAPVGVGAAMAVTVSHSGPGVLRNLGLLVATLYGALVVFALIGFLPVALLSRVPLRRFVRAVKDPAVIAFTTTSSDAALPVAMERMIELGVPRSIVAFVVPTGYSFNLDGSTLYLGVASVFVAQAAGVHQSLGTQLAMMLTLLVASKGVAGVPRGSLVVLSGVLSGYGLPAEGVAVLLGADELMDMARTTVNVVGNCLATVVIARWEGELEVAAEGPRERAATFPALPSS
jgi:proton glutamate symport protein